MARSDISIEIYRLARKLGRVPRAAELRHLYPKVRQRKLQQIVRACKKTFDADKFAPRDYHQSDDSKATDIEIVTKALSNADPPIEMKWYKGKDDERNLTVEDLALGYHAVAVSQKDYKGLSYTQIDKAFKINKGVGCHNNKAARILAVLQELKLIEMTDRHIKGKRGTVYQVVKDVTHDVPSVQEIRETFGWTGKDEG